MKKGEPPSACSTAKGAGSFSVRSFIGVPLIPRETGGGSVAERVTGALSRLVQALQHADLGPLVAQIGVEIDRSEPLLGLMGGFQVIERLRQRSREMSDAGRLAFRPAH